MRIIFVLIFYVASTLPLRAEVLSAHVTGRTLNTGVSQELLIKRATANAIENFLLQNGAKIKAITIVENGEIAFDQIRINSEHRLLGFDTLQHRSTKEYTEVKLNVYYGKIVHSTQCRDRQKFEFMFTGVKTNLSPDAPAFLVNIKKFLHDGIIDISANLDFVQLEYRSASINQPEFDLDYATIAAAQNIAKATKPKSTLTINVKVSQVNSSDRVKANFYTSSSNRKLDSEIGIVSTNVELSVLSAPLFIKKVPRARNEVILDLITPYLTELRKVLNRISCEPVSTFLKKDGNQYRVDIGSQDGVNKNTVFLLEHDQTAGFAVGELFKNETHLIPLQSIFPFEPQDGASLYLIK